MAHIAYTCKYVLPFDVKASERNNLRAQQEKIAQLTEKCRDNAAIFDRLFHELMLARTAIACADEELRLACKQLKSDYERYKTVHQTSSSTIVTEDTISEDDEYEMVDDDEVVWFEVADSMPASKRTRKTKRDILTPTEACKAGKASKRHKLAHKKVAKDSTKTLVAKKQSVQEALKRVCIRHA